MFVTWAELDAVRLLQRAGEVTLSTEPIDIHRLADRIILLAERIKAERATAGMQNAAGA